MRPPLWPGCALAMFCKVVLLTASTKPSPSVFKEVRKVKTFSVPGRRSCIEASVARSLRSEPPGASTKLPLTSRWPARNSVIWLMPPVTGFWWHSAQDCAL